jgi:hypothetical protein
MGTVHDAAGAAGNEVERLTDRGIHQFQGKRPLEVKADHLRVGSLSTRGGQAEFNSLAEPVPGARG